MKTYETKDGVEDYIRMCDGYDNSKFQNELLNHLKEGSSLLEVGMGPGNDFEWLSNTYRVTGSDYSKEFIEKAKARFPEGEFIILDAVSLKSDKKYDGIYSCKVYQHFELDLIEKSLKNQFELLNENGVIAHSFWIGDTVFEGGDMKAIYHNKDRLLSLIRDRFTILEEIEYEEFEPNDSVFILAKK